MCVCVDAHLHVRVCECMCTPGEELWVNWCVAGMGTRGPSPPSRAGRNLGGKEGIETHHKIRASGGKKSPAPWGRPCSLSSGVPSLSSDDVSDGARRALVASQLLPCPVSGSPVVLGLLGLLLRAVLLSLRRAGTVPLAASLLLPPPLAWL